jgi:hypothetical protein
VSGTALFSRVHNVTFSSPDGLNVIFGGGIASSLSSASNAEPSDVLDFKHIYIHDPATKPFHNQTATGTRPTPRIRFCSVGTPGFNGSYEIFVYVGHDPSLSAEQMMHSSDEVFVLFLPGFVWFKADYPATSAREVHTCDIVGQGGSQIIVTGGVGPVVPHYTAENSCDPWTNDINVFDLSAMRWKDGYEPNDTLDQTPSVVRDWHIKNGPYPSWDQGGVKSLFIRPPPPASSPLNPSTHPSDGNTNTGNNPKTGVNTNTGANTGAIAGGVVGGVASLTTIAAVVYCILNKRRKSGQSTKHRKPELEASTNMNNHESMHQESLVSRQGLRETSLLELPSDVQRYKAPISGAIVEY